MVIRPRWWASRGLVTGLMTGLVIGLATTTACRTAPLPRPDRPAVAVRSPEIALTRARQLKDPVAAAEIAWVAGNDRPYARQRLDDALARRPSDPALRLRRGLLALTDLDLKTARRNLTAAVTAAPRSPEAGAALVTLHAWRSELAAESSTVASALLASGLVDLRQTAEPFHRALATALVFDIVDVEDPARWQRAGGWLNEARVVGPLGPVHDRLLIDRQPLEDAVDWSRRPNFRGVHPPIRKIEAAGTDLPIPAGRQRGTYLLQAFFHLTNDREGLIQARMPSFGRVKIDGFEVLERDPAEERPPRLLAGRVRLEAGWHRITVLAAAQGQDAVALSLLDEFGRPLADEVRAEPPTAPLSAATPKILARSIAAIGDGHPYWIANPDHREPERALFGRLAAATTALSPWLDDLEAARAYLYGLEGAAPESAAVRATRARLAAWARLPQHLVQAHLREAIARDPKNPGVLVALGRRSYPQDPERALDWANQAIRAAPDAFAPWALAFDVYQSKQWHAEASAAIERSAVLGAPLPVLIRGARFFRNLGEIKKADALETLGLTRAGSKRRTLTASRALRQGRLAEAIAALDARTPTEMVQTANWALVSGDLDGAVRSARSALAADPLSWRAERALALTALARDDRSPARAAFERLRQLGQTSPQQEALAELAGGPLLDGPAPDSWLGRRLRFDPLPLVAPLPGADRPRGLDASDRWAQHGQVKLLERIIDRVQPDGSAISLRHSIVRLQTKEATDHAGEINLPGGALPLSLRTIKPDGSTVDVDRHDGKEDLSFSALAPGDAVEKKWVGINGPATPWGGYIQRFFLQSASPLVRAELAVVVPRGAKVRYFAYHGAPPPDIHEQEDETVYYWRADEVAPVVPEPQAPHPAEYVPFVVITVDLDRETALNAHTQRQRRRSRRSYEIDRATAAVMKEAGTPHSAEDRARAIFRWLVNHVNHGRGSDPARVLDLRRGDRTGPFAAMLESAGVPAEIVLARSGRAPVIAPSYPDTTDFPATLVRIPLDRQRTLWADMDRASPWLGPLPPWFRGGQFLTRSKDGRPVVRPIQDDHLDQWPIASQLELDVQSSGDASGRMRVEIPGMLGADVARVLAAAQPADQRRQIQQWLASIMPSAQLTGLDISERRSPLAPLVLTASVSVPGFMTTDREHLVAERFFSQPLAGESLGQPGLRPYLRLPRRKTPLLINPAYEISTVVVDFPSEVGNPVEAPRSFVRGGKFGRIEQRFSWDADARRARLERRRLMPLGRISPEDFPAFRTNAQELLQVAENRLIVPISAPPAARAEEVRHD